MHMLSLSQRTTAPAIATEPCRETSERFSQYIMTNILVVNNEMEINC